MGGWDDRLLNYASYLQIKLKFKQKYLVAQIKSEGRDIVSLRIAAFQIEIGSA
jgi:hypothetical protein